MKLVTDETVDEYPSKSDILLEMQGRYVAVLQNENDSLRLEIATLKQREIDLKKIEFDGNDLFIQRLPSYFLLFCGLIGVATAIILLLK